ncbi:hypothetical protein AYO21_10627 [Fonsecaea monophora]|uniref:Major facilitator superfamily (MFS) profile domain-containing protein n=1 Tax=Fonsecaea monophora TaxID=254056 RepID=A0A177EWA5_9EURO|nr:hypothetical protein AYO21_10627 [Fonsecaea monophora]KAH0829722.1 Multidrug resistance protein fnx1 [Fonsecaea pedrosoi]OAG35229.1 hypothetical protein AYO21_10627 [Fonsecaea monophora]
MGARRTRTIPEEEQPLLSDNATAIPPTSLPPAEEATKTEQEEVGGVRLYVTIGSIWLAVFFAAMDSSMMATLTTPVANEFHTFSLLSWVASSYLIATAAVQPLTGRLTEIFGRKDGVLYCIVFFGLGNLICGIANNTWTLIAGRVVAGAGGGGLFAIQTMVVTDLVPLRKRGVWQGIGNIVFGGGSCLGGVFGGWINQTLGWRPAFLIQVPFVVVSAFVVAIYVQLPSPPHSDKNKLARVDFLGAITLVGSLVLLLFGLNSGGNLVPWNHPLVLTTLPLSAVLLIAFLVIEEKWAAEPLILVRLFLNRTVTAACVSNWFEMMSLYGMFFYMPIYLRLRGLNSSQQGSELISQGTGLLVGSLVAGFAVKRTGRYFYLNWMFIGFYVGASVLLCMLDMAFPLWVAPVCLAMFGFGYGGMFVISLLALIAAIDHSEQAIATSASYIFRSTGSTIGVTITSAVFQNVLKASLWSRFGNEPDAATIIGRIRNDLDLDLVPRSWRHGVEESYMGALRSVWFTILALTVLASLTSLAMKEYKLYNTISRREEEEQQQ